MEYGLPELENVYSVSMEPPRICLGPFELEVHMVPKKYEYVYREPIMGRFLQRENNMNSGFR